MTDNKWNRWLYASEFFNPVVLFTVGLFVLNNFWWKAEYDNWVTGKLSDFTFCFFFPLYCAAWLGQAKNWRFIVRLRVAVIFTMGLFALVKIDPTASDWLNRVVSPASEWIWRAPSLNTVDPTDLSALLFVLLAYFFGKKINDYQQNKAA